jgi:Iap family predicted aminopeptidase
MTPVVYDNALVDAALETAASDPKFQHIKPGAWHTADFDSVWFARAGIPSVTISSQDAQGLIPFLHRPDDTIENVDANVVLSAIDFAEATIRRLAASM